MVRSRRSGAARATTSCAFPISGGALPSAKFRFGIGNGALATNSSGQIGTDLSLSTTNLLVTRFVPATGLATIWLNPAVESDPSVTATDPGTATRPNPIDVVSYAFRQSTGEGAMLIDDLRVGTTFQDVVTTNHWPTITSVASQNTAVAAPRSLNGTNAVFCVTASGTPGLLGCPCVVAPLPACTSIESTCP